MWKPPTLIERVYAKWASSSFGNGEIRDRWQTLVDSEDWFDPWNVSIRGIDEDDVRKTPTLPQVYGELRSRLEGSVLVSHTAFDRGTLNRAAARYKLEQLQVAWLASARIARRAWPERYGRAGYGLMNVATDLDISFKHRNAQEDARAAAEIVLRACAFTETNLEGWLRLVGHPLFPRAPGASRPKVRREGKMEGSLFGETIVFTGALGISRPHAADMGEEAGCDVANSVTKKTTMLVVGTQDKSKVNQRAREKQ